MASLHNFYWELNNVPFFNIRYDDTAVTDTTFLVGSEALDEIVGGLKVQLAPKTNFWSNTAGAENVATAVIDLLAPTPKTTVLEIGCGIGLIGLMMASVNKKYLFLLFLTILCSFIVL